MNNNIRRIRIKRKDGIRQTYHVDLSRWQKHYWKNEDNLNLCEQKKRVEDYYRKHPTEAMERADMLPQFRRETESACFNPEKEHRWIYRRHVRFIDKQAMHNRRLKKKLQNDIERKAYEKDAEILLNKLKQKGLL